MEVCSKVNGALYRTHRWMSHQLQITDCPFQQKVNVYNNRYIRCINIVIKKYVLYFMIQHKKQNKQSIIQL